MTTCSTVIALGMMPLCLYLYTRPWNLEKSLTIPYQNIGLYWVVQSIVMMMVVMIKTIVALTSCMANFCSALIIFCDL